MVHKYNRTLLSHKKDKIGVPVVAQWLTNPTRNHEVEGSIPALAQWVNDTVLPCAVVYIADGLGSCVAVALA